MDAEQVRQNFGIDVSADLAEASAEVGTALTELHFDKNEYTDFGEFIMSVDGLPAKPAVKKPSCRSLSVNGKVVQDRMEKYLKTNAESSSALKEVLKSPRHYLIYRNEDLRPDDESHFTLGTFIHSAFLEPTKFNKVKVLPEASKSSKAGVIDLINYYWWLLGIQPDLFLNDKKMDELKEVLFDLETLAKKEGYTFIDAKMSQIVKIVQSSYRTYGGGIIPRLIANGRTEVSMYGRDPGTGLKVKIRPDCMLLEEQVGANIILSVKTTSATSIDAFMRDAAKYRYELAEGMYLQVASEVTGRKFSGTLMLIAQTVIPFQCALLWLDAEDLACGKYKYQQAIDIVRQCKETNNWPGFEAYAEEGACGIIQVRFPGWIKSELKPQYIPDQIIPEM